MLRLALLVVSAATLTACGALGGSSSCDFRTSGANGPESRCQERVGTLTTEAFKATCKVAQGVSADGACPRTDAVGGCFIGAQGDGSKVNDWYYAPMTADDAKHECLQSNGTFLTP